MTLAALASELAADPLARGYSGMDDAVAAASLNTANRDRNRTTMTASEVLNAIDKAEFNALADADKALVWNVLSIGTINPFGLEADLFVDIFSGGSVTITSLQALRKESISRAAELTLGTVTPGLVEEARR